MHFKDGGVYSYSQAAISVGVGQQASMSANMVLLGFNSNCMRYEGDNEHIINKTSNLLDNIPLGVVMDIVRTFSEECSHGLASSKDDHPRPCLCLPGVRRELVSSNIRGNFLGCPLMSSDVRGQRCQ